MSNASIPFVAFAGLMLGAFVWIATDRDTEEIFLIYGPAFPICLDMKAWDIFLIIGAKMVGLFLLVGLALFASFQVSYDALTPTLCVRTLLVLIAFSAFPLTRFMALIRKRRSLSKTIQHLTAFMSALEESQLLEEHQAAEYSTSNGWTAWHPKDHIWNTPETQSIWSGVAPVLPVLYAAEKNRQFAIPFDFDTFLVWNGPLVLQGNKHLPFTGPGNTKFKFIRQRKARLENWWIADAEMDDDDGE